MSEPTTPPPPPPAPPPASARRRGHPHTAWSADLTGPDLDATRPDAVTASAGTTVTGGWLRKDLAAAANWDGASMSGCPDPDGWLAVNVLGLPVLEPDQELDDRAPSAR